MSTVYRQRPFSLIELLIVVGILAILVTMLMVVLQQSREKSLQSRCAAQVRNLGLFLFMYTNDYGGYFPNLRPREAGPEGLTAGNWQPLGTLQYVSTDDGNQWACPSTKEPRSSVENSNYRYIGSGRMDDDPSPSLVTIGYDASGNHPGNRWMNALFIDGHVDGARPDGTRRVVYLIPGGGNNHSVWNLNNW